MMRSGCSAGTGRIISCAMRSPEPGTRFEYNNFNTYMCNCIVERVAGCTLKDRRPAFF